MNLKTKLLSLELRQEQDTNIAHNEGKKIFDKTDTTSPVMEDKIFR